SLPVALTTLEQPTEALVQPPILHLSPNQPLRRILVVDDVAESRLLMRHWLASVGYAVQEACDGQEALEHWAAWQPHLICLDMRMPVLDGYGVARHIRQADADQPQPVILAVTASVFEEQQSVCLAAGCDEVLPKPIQREALLSHVGEWLHLTYQYAEGHLALDSEQGSARLEDRPLTRADLAHLPAPWLTQLRQAAQAADDRRANQLIAELPVAQQDLAVQLTQLVHDFRLDIILDLTDEPLLQGASSP
ncbi:MAG: hypothetical protein RLZZ597_3079, partial [Cyanobacteriota bacterium]